MKHGFIIGKNGVNGIVNNTDAIKVIFLLKLQFFPVKSSKSSAKITCLIDKWRLFDDFLLGFLIKFL